MMNNTAVDNFLQLNLATNLIGLEVTEGVDYFCVPIGANIFAALGTDGVQFCFIEGFDEMVFAISPDATNNKYVNPVAYTFAEFLALVFSCKNANLIEQIYWQSREQFVALLQEELTNVDKEQASVLARLQVEMGITPMSDPYDYVRKVQWSFDYSKLNFSDEFYDVTGLTR